MRRLIGIVLLCCLLGQEAMAQETKQPEYWNEVQSFKRRDSLSQPTPGQILFVGSSSFTRWGDVQEYFPTHQILNRAFGGSRIVDQIRYVWDVIYPYNPKQIVIYCGENDIAYSDTVTPRMVLNRFQAYFELIRRKFPNVPVVFVSLKPSPSREKMMGRMLETNVLIRNYLKKKKKTVFIDVYHAMLTKDGKLQPELYVEDNLHMNASGYNIWKKLIEPHLL